MDEPYSIEISHRGQAFAFSLSGEAVLGRQLTPAEPMGQLYHHAGSGEQRIAVAPFSDVRVSRRQLVLRPAEGGVLVSNASTNPVFIEGRSELAAGGEWLCPASCKIAFGPARNYTVNIWREVAEATEMRTLSHEPPIPFRNSAEDTREAAARVNLTPGEAPRIRRWLRSIIEVLQSAAASEDFFHRAAREVAEIMELDAAQVLMLEDGQWRCRAQCRRDTPLMDSPVSASRRLLERMRRDRRTVWSDEQERLPGDFSQAGLLAVVCAPICNRRGDVIGGLYAERRSSSLAESARLGEAEAMLAETLAYAVAVGLERVTQEKEALEQRVRFEQFFSRELAQQLAENPELLTGKDAEVTILMADIRGFSAISERLGTELTLQWIQDTLDALTEIVIRHGGVVVDYIGDEIMAMWGAPIAESDHARRACQAALEMVTALGPIDARWRETIQSETQVSIGIHTGVAQVGNIGSRKRFKYGALGHAVNLASRVQGANKHLRTSLLATRATHDALGSGFLTRRIGAIQVVNIEQPVDVFEIRPLADERGRVLCQLYEKALGEFEAQQFRRAARTLGDFVPNYEDDGPAHILLWRAVNGLVNPGPTFEQAWKLPGK